MNIFKSKTMTTASVVAAIGAAQAFVPLVQAILTPLLTPEAMGYVMMTIGGVFAFLRVITNKPLSEAIRGVADAVEQVEKTAINTTKE